MQYDDDIRVAVFDNTQTNKQNKSEAKTQSHYNLHGADGECVDGARPALVEQSVKHIEQRNELAGAKLNVARMRLVQLFSMVLYCCSERVWSRVSTRAI
jgi:hypothetical protein